MSVSARPKRLVGVLIVSVLEVLAYLVVALLLALFCAVLVRGIYRVLT